MVHAGMTPNDPSFRKLWGMKVIRADEAWNSTIGTRDVVVGVVDTGVDYTHPDLAANAWSSSSPTNGCPAGTHGYNAITATCDPMDDNRHGTHVAGTIGAAGNNGVGVIGVNGTTQIMGLKFLSSGGSGQISNAVKAIDWAVRAKQAGVNIRVLSNSLGRGRVLAGAPGRDQQGRRERHPVRRGRRQNGTSNDATPVYPCNYHAANEVCVAATDSHDSLCRVLELWRRNGRSGRAGVEHALDRPRRRLRVPQRHVDGDSARLRGGRTRPLDRIPVGLDAQGDVLSAVDPLASLAGRVATGGRLDVCKAIPACSGVAPPSPAPPPPTVGDFSLATDGGRQAVSPGGATTYTVTVTPSGGFFGEVDLSVSGLPGDTNASFAPASLSVASTPGSSILRVTAGAAAPSGNYSLTITGTSGALTPSTPSVSASGGTDGSRARGHHRRCLLAHGSRGGRPDPVATQTMSS